MVLLWLCSAGCRDRESAPAKAIELLPIDCAELRRDGVCELAARHQTLDLWLPRESGELARVRAIVGTDARELSTDAEKTQAGARLTVALPRGASSLTVETDRGTRTLRLAAFDARIEHIKSLRGQGKLGQAEAQARALLAATDARTQARARGLLARVHLSNGKIDEAIGEFRRSLVAADAAGLLTSANLDRVALGDTLRRAVYDLPGAREVLEKVTPELVEPWAQARYELALADRASGDARSALEGFAEVDASARQFGLVRLVADNSEARAMLLAELGRFDEALAELERSRAFVPDTACSRAARLANTGWVKLLAAQARSDIPPDPAASSAAAELFRHECPLAWSLDSVLVDVALAQAFLGHDQLSLQTLQTVHNTDNPGFEIESFRAELEGQLLRKQGHAAEALTVYERMAALGGGAAPPAHRYRAAMGRALTLRALGRAEQALRALGDAELELERQQRAIPLGDARSSFLGIRQDVSVELTDLLLELGRSEEALNAVRRSRRRLLASAVRADRLSDLPPAQKQRWERGLEEFARARARAEEHAQNAWRVPEQERKAYREHGEALARDVDVALDRAMMAAGEAELPLAPLSLAPSEALLTAHPVRGGWAAFLLFRGQVHMSRFVGVAGQDDAALAQALLAPFARELQQASSLRVLSGGDLDRVAVHALPFAGAALLDALPVMYSLDLPPRAQDTRAGESAPLAGLLVANPRGDLPLSEREADVVEHALATRAAPIELRRARATLPALLAALPRASWFHYAGHASLSRQGLLRSSLALADGKELTLSDVLLLPHVPRHVVLAACESARTQEAPVRGAVASFGLAHAFVLAGSQAVLAANEAIPDRVALAAAQELYGDGFDGQLDAVHFRRALLALRGAFPAEWAMLRLIVP